MSAIFSPCRTWRYSLTREIREPEVLAVGGLALEKIEDGQEVALDLSTGVVSEPRRTVLFVCLNPSTADETQDDPTVRRCIGFARRWGFDRLVVCNIFGIRSTNPSLLYSHEDPVGPDNVHQIAWEASQADKVIAAWGNHGEFMDQGDYVRSILRQIGKRVHVLALNRTGQPKHPLYVAGDTEAVIWE